MIKLYRADRAGKKTLPERYFTEGMLTKQLNSGDDPRPFKKYGWIKTIKNHISYDTVLEEHIYRNSQFLSFTLEKKIAKRFLSTRQNLDFLSSDRQNAEAFLFSVILNIADLKELDVGLYEYTYRCNYQKLFSDPKFQSGLSPLLNCNICSELKDYQHKLLVIDVVKYLSHIPGDHSEEIALAETDQEWLLMPIDPMIGKHSIGFQSRIQIADFWTVDFYKYIKEDF